MNLPNLITTLRLVLIIPFVYLMQRAGHSTPDGIVMGTSAWLAAAIFAVASYSDWLDGWLARSRGLVTKLGQFLDPLADKLLIGSAMVTLVAYRRFPLWAALVIGVREVLISILRSMALKRGRDMPATLPGKIKTAFQVPMVLVWLLPRRGALVIVQDVSVYLSVILTLVSGVMYAAKTSKLLSRDAKAGH
ncbi:MAG TPA: CDP-diacylglycerol--glycerol-3-phosphate 3-phosphatidyltransferase [Actinomycetota bacterium]|nr:CDP-diacylglycerol--glycerol-3-phosphate 3-phosphatidyltransferase [Actinomycetota bacterium]